MLENKTIVRNSNKIEFDYKVPWYCLFFFISFNIEGDAKKIGHILGVVLQEKLLLSKFYIENGQKYFSRALKWGIACLCISYTFGDRAKSLKISIFKFSQFCKNQQIYKVNSKNEILLKAISPKLSMLHKHVIPHFKAL